MVCRYSGGWIIMDDIMQMHAWAYEIATGNGIQTKCRLGDGYLMVTVNG